MPTTASELKLPFVNCSSDDDYLVAFPSYNSTTRHFQHGIEPLYTPSDEPINKFHYSEYVISLALLALLAKIIKNYCCPAAPSATTALPSSGRSNASCFLKLIGCNPGRDSHPNTL